MKFVDLALTPTYNDKGTVTIEFSGISLAAFRVLHSYFIIDIADISEDEFVKSPMLQDSRVDPRLVKVVQSLQVATLRANKIFSGALESLGNDRLLDELKLHTMPTSVSTSGTLTTTPPKVQHFCHDCLDFDSTEVESIARALKPWVDETLK